MVSKLTNEQWFYIKKVLKVLKDFIYANAQGYMGQVLFINYNKAMLVFDGVCYSISGDYIEVNNNKLYRPEFAKKLSYAFEKANSFIKKTSINNIEAISFWVDGSNWQVYEIYDSPINKGLVQISIH